MAATVKGSVALVTGGNRGIGRAFVEALLDGGADKVYVAARDVAAIGQDLLDRGAVALELDVTDPAQVESAAGQCADIDILINNAGFHARDRLVRCEDPGAARQEMEVNFFGVLNTTRAFADVLAANGGGAIVNVLSVAGSVPTAHMGGYSPAKSAALFLSTISRAELAEQDTTVTALIVGSVDTRMADHVNGPKATPASVAQTGLKAMERGERITDTDERALRARAMYALDPARYERAQAKILTLRSLENRH